MPGSSFCVYEIVNNKLLEVILGISETDNLAEIRKKDQEMPPVWMQKWRPEHGADYKIVECGLSRKEARDFIKAYGKASAWNSFKIFVLGS